MFYRHFPKIAFEDVHKRDSVKKEEALLQEQDRSGNDEVEQW